jgi:hypothetical protein
MSIFALAIHLRVSSNLLTLFWHHAKIYDLFQLSPPGPIILSVSSFFVPLQYGDFVHRCSREDAVVSPDFSEYIQRHLSNAFDSECNS